MTVVINRVVAGVPCDIRLTEKEIHEAREFFIDLMNHEENGKVFNKAFLLHKNVKTDTGTHEVSIILKRLELEECYRTYEKILM